MCPGFESLWAHQIFSLGYRQAVRHWVLIPAFVSSNLATPAKRDPLAQSAEHLTFNQGVRSSNLRWVTNSYRGDHASIGHGEVSEWFKELVLKTSDSARGPWVRIHPLRHILTCWRSTQVAEEDGLLNVRVRLRAAWVRIPSSSAIYPLRRGIAQLVEQWSPKPRVEGSSPSAPANYLRPSGCSAVW